MAGQGHELIEWPIASRKHSRAEDEEWMVWDTVQVNPRDVKLLNRFVRCARQ
jgi:hypothetical protein